MAKRSLEAIRKAKPRGAPIPALKTAAALEREQTGLIDLQEGFSAPGDWAATNQEYMESLRQAQFEGAGNAPEIGPDYISVEWKNNYRSETRGPNGEALPSDAIGWRPTGKPDFGGGFSGVLKGAWYSLYDKPRGKIEARDLGAFGPTATSLRDDLTERLSRDVSEENIGQEFLGLSGSVLSHGVQYLKDLWSTAEDNETIFGKTTQLIGAGFDLVAGSAEELAKVVETKVIGPQVLASDELIRRGAEKGIIPEGEAEWLDKLRPLGGFSALAPVAVAAKYRLQGVISENDYAAAVDRNQDAARMAYTAWFDPAAKEEYIRRMRGGDDPRLLALELENPGAEMVGRIVFDPLNFIDILQVGSIVHKTLRLNRARKELTTIASPELAKALDGLSVAGESGAPLSGREVLDSLGAMYDATREGRIEVAGRRGFLRATAGGKRATYGQRANNFMSTIISMSGNDPDLANSVWHGMVLAADADEGRRLEGMTILSQAIGDSKGALTPGILFSSSANETAILLRRLLENDAGEFDTGVLLRMLEDAGDDPEKLAGLLDRRLNEALAKDFPTIQEQTALNEEFLKLDGEEAAQFLERNPLANRDPGAFYKSLAKVDDALQPIYRRMGEFQARLFMGTPPASWRYRANNRWGNFMPTLVDVGPEPAIKGLLKGFPGFKASMGPQASMDEIARNLGGVLPEGAIRGLGPARSFRGGQNIDDAKGDWLNRTTTSGLRGAADDEAANAAGVVNHSVRKTMKSYMKAERRLINKELAALPEEQRNLVMAAMREKYYNVDEAIDVLRSEEGYDISRNLAFLSDDEVEELRELRIYDAALLAARENDDLDDVLRRIDDIMEERGRVGMEAGGEAPALNMEDVSGESIARESHVPNEYENVRATDMHMRRRKEVNEFDRLYDDALFGPTGLQRMATEQIMRNSLTEGARVGMTDDQKIKMAMAQLDGVTGPLQQEIRTATDGTFDTSRAFTTDTWDISRGSKGRKAGDKWLTRKWMERDAIAKQLGLPGLGPVPEGLTARQFRDAIWQHDTSSYYKIQDARWTQLRDTNADRYRVVAKRLAGAAGIEDFHTPAVNSAEAQLIQSRMMDRATILPDGRTVVNFSADQEGITDLTESIAAHLGVQVNPELHIGLIERVDPVTGETGLGLASIDELPEGGSRITLTDELLNQDVGTIKESLGHELSHLFEDTEDGARVLAEQYGGDFELFVRDILYQTGLQRRTAPTAARSDALREMLEANPDIGASIGAMRDLEETGRGPRVVLPEVERPAVGVILDSELAEEAAKTIRFIRRKIENNPEDFRLLLQRAQADLDLYGATGGERGSLFEAERHLKLSRRYAEQDKATEVLSNIESAEQQLSSLRGEALPAPALEPRGGEFRMPIVGSADDAAPTPNRIFHETQPAAADAAERLKRGLQDNWGQTGRMGALDPETEAAISQWAFGARGRVTEARAQAISVANQTRDFILHNYPVRYGADLVAGYIWPYQFWHSRTYLKWMQRMVMHPGMVAAYSHYRNSLEKQHAGLPPWWRRNINVTDLLGIETDSPLWFNLERSLNPIQGLTGVDFTDPKRRLDNWSATVEDLNKFGPSVWMPYQVALALKYHIDGEEEAASRWAGRLWSPTGAFRDMTALVDPEGLGVELDPFIHLFGGGVGPWERGRIGKQLGAAQGEGVYSQAELVDAARLQSGPIWDEMRARAINQRAPNVPFIMAPFFLGGGFKMRTESDAQIDMFYSEMIGLMRKKEDLEPDEYRQAWNDLERRYPFMDVLLLSKKSGPDRDEALAWSVLDRIPPAMTNDIAEMVGINPDIIGLFHENNGSLEKMSEADRTQFIGAILEMAAILDVPDNATKAEWETAKSIRRAMRAEGEELFGEDIWERVDAWWAVFDPEDRTAGDAMMARDPGIQQAQDWQQRMIMTTPLLGAYYTSEERIRKFYKRQLYDSAEEIFGEDLWAHLAVQTALFDSGDRKAAFQYRDDHPQLEGWTELRDQTLPEIETKVDRIGSLLPDAIEPVFRDREQAEVPDGPPVPSTQDFINAQILAYSTGVQQDDAPKDVKDFIRAQADSQWPGTRSEANLYYKRLDQKVEVAQKMLMHNSALSARVAWEAEALRNLSLVQEGQFAQVGEQPPSPTWQEWQGVLTTPLFRLTRDMLRYGDNLGDDEIEELLEVSESLGIEFEELMLRLEGAYEEAEGVPVTGAGTNGNLGTGGLPSLISSISQQIGNTSESVRAGLTVQVGEVEAARLLDRSTDQTIEQMKEIFPSLKEWIFDSVGPSIINRSIRDVASGIAHAREVNVRIGQRFARQQVPRIIELAQGGDALTMLHEMAHQLDTVGAGGRLSESGSFKRAVRNIIEDPTVRTPDEGPLVRVIQEFPGIGGNPMAEASLGAWGGNVELFAALMSASGGNLRKIPEPLRPFYSRFMKEGERVLAPREVVPEGVIGDIAQILGSRTANFVSERIGVNQGTGDIEISDGAIDAVMERARTLGLDEEATLEDVLRILGIDF